MKVPIVIRQVAVTYPRQSKTSIADVDTGESLSSRNQIDKGKAYAFVNGFDHDDELAAECVDLDISGGAKEGDRRRGVRSWQKRPGLARLYEAAKEGRFQHLIVYDLNRLGGNDTELHLIREAFGDCGVTIHVVKYGIRTDTDMGRMVYGIFAQFAHQRLKDISETVRDNMHKRAKEGRHHGTPPFWIAERPSHAVTPEQIAVEVAARGPRGTAGWFELHPVFAPIMREIITCRMAGMAYADIARQMNSPNPATGRDAPAPTMMGATWSAGGIAFLLNANHRLKLRGYSVYGRHSKEGDNRRVVNPGIFPALLTDAEADALDIVQNTLSYRGYKAQELTQEEREEKQARSAAAKIVRSEEHKRASGPVRLATKTNMLCSGILVCAVCARAGVHTVFRSVAQSRSWWQYVCMTSGERIDIPHPTMHGGKAMYLSRIKVDHAVTFALAAIAKRLPVATPPATSKTPARKPKVVKPKRSVKDLDDLIDSLFDLRANKRIKEEDFDRRYNLLVDERNKAREIEQTATIESEMDQARQLLSELPPIDASKAQVQADKETNTVFGIPTATLRLILRLLVDRVETPIVLPGLRSSVYSGRDLHCVRLVLKQPLPDGTKTVLTGTYHAWFAGARLITFETDSPSE